MWRIFLVIDLEALMLQHPMRSSRQEKSAELATQRGLCALQRCLLRRRLDMGDGLADCLEVGIADPQDQLFFIWIHLPSHSHCFLTTTQPEISCNDLKGQHFVYNVAFTRIFGAGMDLRVGVQKVLADLFGHVSGLCVSGADLRLGNLKFHHCGSSPWMAVALESQKQTHLLWVPTMDTSITVDDFISLINLFFCSIFSHLFLYVFVQSQVPFMYLPLYYMFEDTALGVGTPSSGLQRWWTELPSTMAAYCKIFPMRLDH